MYRLILTFVLCGLFQASAQLANDCVNAVPVCGNSVISSNATGSGLPELDHLENSCVFGELNSLWLKLNIAEAGDLIFTITPDNPDISVDYDFYIFGPNPVCNNITEPIRCSTTNPLNAGLSNNLTGLSASESDESEGPGADGNSFLAPLNVLAGETYMLLVDRPHGSGGFDLEWEGSAQFYDPPPIIGEPDPISICITYPGQIVDLTQNNHQFLADPDTRPSYYTSYADAFDQQQIITSPEAFPLSKSGDQTLFVRVSAPSGCFEIVELHIDSEIEIDQEFKYALCDAGNDLQESFHIPAILNDIESNLENPTLFNISLHSDENLALTDTSPLPLTTLTTGTTIIFARIEKIDDSSCLVALPIFLQVVESPIPNGTELVQCDVDLSDSTDGITILNLHQVFNGAIDPDTEYYFYETIDDRNNHQPIAEPLGYYNNVPFNQTMYYSLFLEECILEGDFTIRIEPTTVSLTPTSPFYACDEDAFDGTVSATFDLEAIRSLNYPNLEATFYASLIDLALEQNELGGRQTLPNTTIYVRIENSNQCQGVESFELLVNESPTFNFPETLILCTDNPPLKLVAPAGFDHYAWWDNSGNLLGNTAKLSLDHIGDYILEIGNEYVLVGQTYICSTQKPFTVTASNKAIIENIDITDLAADNTVTLLVGGDGSYEYSMDGFAYQNSPTFNNVPAGIHSIYVRDQLGCGITETEIAVIGYQRFFTPNNDSHNDYWKIKGITEVYNSLSKISIFNRYGALLAQLPVDGPGWDGTFNGLPLPSSDYWFKIQLEDGRVFQGHFALKR